MNYAAFLTIAFLSFTSYSFSQEYSYTHYDVTEGLAGSTVYCITQDKEGFIWAGTETGVSRFDGTHFKNFTTADGLPDVEILQMFGDSKGRVWMAPFRRSVCYYYQGRIHNQDNDSLLRGIHLKGNVESFAEDAGGDILIQERAGLHLVFADGAMRQYDSIEGRPIREAVAISRNPSGDFWVQEGQKIWAFSREGFSFFHSIHLPDFHPGYIAMSPHWVAWRKSKTRSAIGSLTTTRVFYRLFDSTIYKHNTYSLIDDSLVFFNELTGATQFNTHTGQAKLLLPGKAVSRTFRDASGNLWFSTMGQGIYRLNSEELRTVTLSTGDATRTSVYGIIRTGNYILAGNDHNHIYKLSLPDFSLIGTSIGSNDAKNRILFIEKIARDRFLSVSDSGPSELDEKMRLGRRIAAGVKSLCRKDDDEWLMSTNLGVAIFKVSEFRFTDTLWRERATAVYYRQDSVYIGTLNGLYRINPDKSNVFLGEKILFLRKRIASLAASADHILWAASYDGGIIGIKNDSVVATITQKQGLTSDICRTLLVHDNILWVGTDKGLNKVELDKPGYPVTRYTSNDGLGSDIINSIYADSSMIYIGTPAGLSYFDQSKIRTDEECRLYLLAVLNAGNDRIGDTAHLRLSYKKNDLRLEFAGISYRSVGNITYRYRMQGLDSVWKETKETFLDYPILPSGSYEFQLQAVNKFDIRSRIISLPFVIDTPFWRAVWFQGILLLAFLLLVWLFVTLRIRSIRRRQEEKEQLNQRMVELENKALQAQMNPHFIFNCLNSIQQYIFGQDILAANKYIAGLAKLIRATLQNSTLSFISLAEEVDFLSTYLSLEKLRFKDKMNYSIRVDPGIDSHSVLIPPMLVQPYVENSMRHGLRHKADGKGSIRIEMKQQGDWLTIIVEDNGIGRQQAARYKTAEHIEYQSKGMSLTADRIRMMNANYDKDIKIEVTDLNDDEGPAGTRVVIQFRLFDAILKNANL